MNNILFKYSIIIIKRLEYTTCSFWNSYPIYKVFWLYTHFSKLLYKSSNLLNDKLSFLILSNLLVNYLLHILSIILLPMSLNELSIKLSEYLSILILLELSLL